VNHCECSHPQINHNTGPCVGDSTDFGKPGRPCGCVGFVAQQFDPIKPSLPPEEVQRLLAEGDDLRRGAERRTAPMKGPPDTPEVATLRQAIADMEAAHRAEVAALVERCEGSEKEAQRLRRLEARLFPIMGGPAIPWAALAPHEAQAQRNHGQSLERLAQRGGLDPAEAVAILEDRRWDRQPPPPAQSIARMLELVRRALGCPRCDATEAELARVREEIGESYRVALEGAKTSPFWEAVRKHMGLLASRTGAPLPPEPPVLVLPPLDESK